MSREENWLNQDGLNVGFGTRAQVVNGSFRVGDNGSTELLHGDVDGISLALTVGVSEDAIVHGVVIPAGATILKATLKVSEAFTSGGAATLDVGTYDQDGAVVDADGIFAAVDLATLILGAEVDGAGADVNTVVPAGGYKIASSYNVAAYDTGKATLVVEYKPV